MTPKLKLVSVSSAVTYRFEPEGREFGWALCTVNDATGELSIQSDWGNWSHRWNTNPSHLGAPTLTHFIADREAWDYLAAKLLGRRNCHEWDPAATVREFRKRLVESRLERGRSYARVPQCLRSPSYLEPIHPAGRILSRETAREMWDLLGDLEHACDSREFLDRFMADDDLCFWVSERPFDELQERTSRDYEILAKSILPALISACAARVQSVATQPEVRT